MLLLFIHTQHYLPGDRDSPGQTSLHYILIVKKDGEGMEAESVAQSLDWEWHQLDYTLDREARII